MKNTPSPYFPKRHPPQQDGFIELSEFMEVEEPHPTLREYWLVFRRQRWLILMCVTAVLLCVTLYTFTRAPIYTAQASILLERKPPQVLKIQDALSESIENAEYYKTQYEILKSRALAARVIREHALETVPIFSGTKDASQVGFVAGLVETLTAWTTGSAEPAKKPLEPGVPAGVITAYLSMVKIQPVPGTGLVRVVFSTPEPLLSARLANTHSTTYVRYGLDLRSKTNEEALAFLDKKLLELKDRLETSEAALNSYRRDKGIISLSDKENIVVDRLADLNKRLTEAEAERISLEAKVRAIRHGNSDGLPAGIAGTVAQNLKNEITRLEGEQAQLAKEFKPGYPPLDKVTAQLENTRRRLRSELQSDVRSIESTYQAAQTKEAALRAQMLAQKNETLKLKDSAVEYAILDREVNTNRQLYDSILQRMREMSVAAEVQSSNVYVVDKAEVPPTPSYPNKTRSLLLGLFFGLALGIGLGFMRERWKTTFTTPEDLERSVRLPLLGVVPDFMRLKTRDRSRLSYVRPATSTQAKRNNDRLPATVNAGDLTITEYHPFSVVTEAYRTLRSALLLARAGEPARTILLTSATRGEGKTTTLVNTAIVFAHMGGRVLIIDGDLRLPRCHKLLKVENDVGLAEVLAGQVEPLEVTKHMKVENLFVITSGAIPPNPAELLSSQRMSQVIGNLQEHFDYIFIDSSPVLPVSDALHVATMVNGVLFVVDGHKTPRQVVNRARLRLTNARIKILGVLLNRINVQEGSYADYYGHYYNYYGYDEREEQRA